MHRPLTRITHEHLEALRRHDHGSSWGPPCLRAMTDAEIQLAAVGLLEPRGWLTRTTAAGRLLLDACREPSAEVVAAAAAVLAQLDELVGDPALAAHVDVLRRYLHGDLGLPIGTRTAEPER